jgi:hypothetical protein
MSYSEFHYIVHRENYGINCKKWLCLYGCKNTFGRKYNAERHNITIHNEMAVIYNKETDLVSNKRKINGNI